MTFSHTGASELAQLMEGTTAGALIPEIVRRGFQDLLEAEVSALTAPSSMSAAPISAPPIATATASGCSPPRSETSPSPSPSCDRAASSPTDSNHVAVSTRASTPS